MCVCVCVRVWSYRERPWARWAWTMGSQTMADCNLYWPKAFFSRDPFALDSDFARLRPQTTEVEGGFRGRGSVGWWVLSSGCGW